MVIKKASFKKALLATLLAFVLVLSLVAQNVISVKAEPTTIDLATYISGGGTLPIDIIGDTTLTGALPDYAGAEKALIMVKKGATLTLDGVILSRTNTADNFSFVTFEQSGTVNVIGENTFSQGTAKTGITGITGVDENVNINVVGESNATLKLSNVNVGVGVAIEDANSNTKLGTVTVKDLTILSSTAMVVGIGVGSRNAEIGDMTLMGTNTIKSDISIVTGVGFGSSNMAQTGTDIIIGSETSPAKTIIEAPTLFVGVGSYGSNMGNITINGNTDITLTGGGSAIQAGIGTYTAEMGNITINGDTNINLKGDIRIGIGTDTKAGNIDIKGNTNIITTSLLRGVGIGAFGTTSNNTSSNLDNINILGDTKISFLKPNNSKISYALGIGVGSGCIMDDITIEGATTIEQTGDLTEYYFMGIGAITAEDSFTSRVNAIDIDGKTTITSKGDLSVGVGAMGLNAKTGNITIKGDELIMSAEKNLNLGVGAYKSGTTGDIVIESTEANITSPTFVGAGVGAHEAFVGTGDITIKGDELNINSKGEMGMGVGAFYWSKTGNVDIESLATTITSVGTMQAGVGAYKNSTTGTVIIESTKTNITSGDLKAGIGAHGEYGTTGDITIKGDELNIDSKGEIGLGVGAFYYSKNGKINLESKKTTIKSAGSMYIGVGSYENSTAGDIKLNGDVEISSTGSWIASGVGSYSNGAKTGDITIGDSTVVSTNFTINSPTIFKSIGDQEDKINSVGTIKILNGNLQAIQNGENKPVSVSKTPLNAQGEELAYYTMASNNSFTGETVKATSGKEEYIYKAAKNTAYSTMIGMFLPNRMFEPKITSATVSGKVVTITLDKGVKDNALLPATLLESLTITPPTGEAFALDGAAIVSASNDKQVIFTPLTPIVLDIGTIIAFGEKAFKDVEIGYMLSLPTSYTIPTPPQATFTIGGKLSGGSVASKVVNFTITSGITRAQTTQTATTDASGNFALSAIAKGANVVVTPPIQSGYNVDAGSLTFPSVSANIANANFTYSLVGDKGKDPIVTEPTLPTPPESTAPTPTENTEPSETPGPTETPGTGGTGGNGGGGGTDGVENGETNTQIDEIVQTPLAEVAKPNAKYALEIPAEFVPQGYRAVKSIDENGNEFWELVEDDTAKGAVDIKENVAPDKVKNNPKTGEVSAMSVVNPIVLGLALIGLLAIKKRKSAKIVD